MATIRTAIVVQDMASSIFDRIHAKLNKTTSGFEKLNNQMSVAPTKAINNAEKMTSSAVQTELAYQAELQTLRQVESEARKIIAAQGTETYQAQEIIASVREQRNLVQNLKADYDNVTNGIKQNNEEQNKFNNSLNTADVHGNKLLNTIKKVAVAIGGITAVKNLMDLSDEVTNNRARLSYIVDDGGSVQELENKIFASSMRARASYQTTTDTIAKLGLQAGKAFKNNDELIAFAEQLNKTFVVSGANASGIESTMYNLTQALSSGVLRGQDLNAVFSNAPQIVQNIADYLNVDIGKIREMAAEGKISASIIKNAMLAAADETNERFAKMPMTWSQIWTKAKNIAIKALDPVLVKINELANNEQVQEMFNMFINGASLAAQAILWLIEGVSWLISILEPFAPIIWGIVAAYVAFNVISGIVSAVLGVVAFAHEVAAAAEASHAIATAGATGAQWSLNAALFACPITWIVVLIIALIVALTYLWFTNDDVAYWMLFAWDSLYIGILTVGLGIKAIWFGLQLAAMYLWLGIQTCLLGIMTAWYGLQTGIDAVCLVILSIFQGLYNGVVGIVNGIINVLNKIPGVEIDTVESATFADDFAKGMEERIIDRNQKLQDMASEMEGTMDKINSMKADFSAELTAGATEIQNKAIELNATREDRTAHRNDWINNAGSAIKDAMNNFDLSGGLDNSETLGNIAGNTKDTADNTAEISDEDLQYLLDIAERDTINRFTTAEIKVEMNNNNNINGETDIDGIVDSLAAKLEEELEYVSESVHE